MYETENIVYTWLSSSGSSSTAKNLRMFCPNYEILSPDLPILPDEALDMLRSLCKKEHPNIIIGTSMGGMFAGQLRGYRKILVNPAFHVSEFMRTQIGVHEFLNPRQDGKTQYEITSELCDAYQAIEKCQFEDLSPFDQNKTYALFGKNDTLVHGHDEFIAHYKKDNARWFEGEHRLNFEITKDIVVPLIHKIMKEEIKEKLLSSPLFNLSLSSKELFHSNFLSWIGERYPDLFIAIFEELGCSVKWKSKAWKVKRELLNLDLCVQLCNGEHIPFVLENKVKSIPRKNQLDEYAAKLKPTPEDNLILLSLATEFPDKKDIEKEGKWKICSYKQLYEAITISKNKKNDVEEPYHRALIEDYCLFIQSLHTLAQSWKVNEGDTFLLAKTNKEYCNELRIGDLQDKIWYSQLCVKLNQHLNDLLKVRTISGLNIEEIKGKETNSNKVYTNWGFTHGQGLLEAKVKIHNEYILLVQLQGDRYCRGIEWIREKPATHEEYWENTKNEKIPQSFFQFDDEAVEFPSICIDANKKIEARKHKDGTRTYNKYGDRFLYQSKKIQENATVSEVLNAIKEDIEKIISR